MNHSYGTIITKNIKNKKKVSLYSLDLNGLIYLKVSNPVNFIVSGNYLVIVGLIE